MAAHYISLMLFPLLSQLRWDANFLLVHNQIKPQPATAALNLVEAESNIRERVIEVIAKMQKEYWRDEGRVEQWDAGRLDGQIRSRTDFAGRDWTRHVSRVSQEELMDWILFGPLLVCTCIHTDLILHVFQKGLMSLCLLTQNCPL